MLRITGGKGFRMEFANGWTASVQFGAGNYCEHEFRKGEPSDFSTAGGNDSERTYCHESTDAECWAIGPNGLGEGNPQGYLSADEVLKFLNDTAGRDGDGTRVAT